MRHSTTSWMDFDDEGPLTCFKLLCSMLLRPSGADFDLGIESLESTIYISIQIIDHRNEFTILYSNQQWLRDMQLLRFIPDLLHLPSI